MDSARRCAQLVSVHIKKGDIIRTHRDSLDECVGDQGTLDFMCLAVTEKGYIEGTKWSPGSLWYGNITMKDEFKCLGKVPAEDLVLFTHWKHKSKRFFKLLGT